MDYYGIIFRSEVGGNAPDGDVFDTAFAQYLNKIHPTYEITVTLTNGTVTGDTTIKDGRTAKVTLSANSGYDLPALDDISITGATIQSYNTSTGELVIANPTFNVSIVAACVVESYAITTTVTNGTASGDESIEAGGTASVTVTAASGYALPSSITVNGATYTYDSTTGVIALSAPTGAVTIAVVCEEASSYPVKGDIIGVDMDGDGTDEQYLVLKSNGSVAEVLARVSVGNTSFAASGQVYENNALDTMLNTTYYDTLSVTAKTAIVDKSIKQKKWSVAYSGTTEPYYNCTYGTTPTAYKIKESESSYNTITRHIYALGVEDFIDYLGATTDMTSDNTTINRDNVRALLEDPNNSYGISTRDCAAESGVNSVSINHFNGWFRATGVSWNYSTFPAFQIDLSKIAWTPSNS